MATLLADLRHADFFSGLTADDFASPGGTLPC
jgi:hypothetical protein